MTALMKDVWHINKQTVKIAAGAAGVLAGLVIALLGPFEGLDASSMQGLGIVSTAIIWWVFSVFPEYITAILMCVCFVLLGLVEFETVFQSFSGTTWWLLVGAMGLGAAITKSGLLIRFAFQVMRLFPRTFSGQVLGQLATGVITAPFVPSMAAKMAMLAPISMAVSDAMGYERKSKAATGIFSAMFTGIFNMAPVFLSASAIGYFILGLLPAETQAQFSMQYWFICILPWGVVVSILNYLAIMRLYQPPEERQMPPAFIETRLNELGTLRGDEKLTAGITLMSLLLWATEPWHGIPPVLVALSSLGILWGLNIMDRDDFKDGIPWDSLVFIGTVLNLGLIFQSLRIDVWVIGVFQPILADFAGNIYLLILALSIVTYLVRFLIASQMAYISIFLVFLIPLAQQIHVNPWIFGIIIYCTVSPWTVLYQNPVYLVAYYASDEMASHSQAARLSLAFKVISVLGLWACVPLWHYLALIP